MKIVHAADLHIDSPLRGLDRYEGAPVDHLRGATRRALQNLVAMCIEERADVLLLAGDVFDGSWKDYSTGLFFVSQMARLREANVPVLIVRGNHDAASSVIRALRYPENVRELGDAEPESYELRDVGIVVHGQSFTQRVTSQDLAARYPDRRPGLFNIGLLHTSIDGREGHEPYAPTSLQTMRSRGYDYWALGHVHKREVVSVDPFIVFPGNLQGRHARETGPKGASIITVEDNVVVNIEHRALDVVRWEMVTVDASQATDAHDVVDLVRHALDERAREASDRILAARVVITGATRANNAIRRDPDRFIAELRAVTNDELTEGDAWLEKIMIRTRGIVDIERIREEASAVGHLARRLHAIKDDPNELAELAGVFADLDKRLPPELREGEGALRLLEPATLRALVEEVEQMLVPRLLEGSNPSSGSSGSTGAPKGSG